MQMRCACVIALGQHELRFPKANLHPEYTWDVGRHCNAEWEFHFIKSGTCHVDIEASQYRLGAGMALLIEPGLYHRAKSLTADFQRLTLCFSLSAGSLYQQLSEKLRAQPAFTPNAQVLHILDMILEECKPDRSYADTYLDALLRCLSVALLRNLRVTDAPVAVNRDIPGTQLTQIIDTYFEQHFSDSGGEAELAKLLHFSRRHLIRILQKHYGMSFREKLTRSRMDYAALLLRTTGRSVSSIGTEIGYGSESAFFKIFRRTFGMTPRQYRNIHK